MNTQRVWLVTGTSKGLGLDLTKFLLENNQIVIATSRNKNAVEEQITENKENLYAVSLDITDDLAVKKVVDEYEQQLGKIDVVVNNAGYSLVGSVEETTDEEFRATIDVNLFGTVNIIRNVTPYMRKRKSGWIINISSGSGYSGNACAASYNAAKFAVIGLTEGFAKETSQFGIKTTVVAPGQFRTSFMDSIQYVKNRVEDYKIDEAEKLWSSMSGQQKGDPKKLAAIIASIPDMENPPLHLLVGTDVYQPIVNKRKKELEEFKKWEHITLSTDIE